MTLIPLLVYLIVTISFFLTLMIAAPDDKPVSVAMLSLLWLPIAVGAALYFAGKFIMHIVRKACDKE